MQGLWTEYEKVLWKQRQIENNLHETVCADYKDKPWCRCKTLQQELADWDSYVLAHYSPPLPTAAKTDWGDRD